MSRMFNICANSSFCVDSMLTLFAEHNKCFMMRGEFYQKFIRVSYAS